MVNIEQGEATVRCLRSRVNCGFFGSPFAPIQHASDFSRLSLREEYTSNVSQGSNTNASDLASGVRKSASSAYTKPKGQLPDYETPVVLHDNRSTVEDFCNNLHKSIMKEFKYGLVWGSSVKHNPQKVGKDHQLQDEDVVQVVKRV